MPIFNKNSAEYNIFTDPHWYSGWLDAVAENPRYKTINLEGMPLVVKRRKRPYPFNRFIEYPAQDVAYDIDICAYMNNAGAQTSRSLKLLREFINNGGCDVIDLRHLNNNSATLQSLKESLSDRHCVISDDDKVWKIELSSPDLKGYLKQLSSDYAKRYQYYLNRIKKNNQFKFYFIENDFERYWEQFIILHKERMADKHAKTILARSDYMDFYKNLSARHMKEDTLRMACLELCGKIRAMLLGIEKYNTFYYINSGFSADISKYSPGIVIPLLCIEYSIQKGIKYFNLLGGDDKYKRTLGAKPHLTKRVTIYRKRIIRLMEELFNRIVYK